MTGGRFSNLEIDDRGNADKKPPQKKAGHNHRGLAFHLAAAREHELAGRLDKAATSFAAALGERPNHHPAWVGQVLMMAEQENYRETLVWADRALQTFPDDPDFLGAKSLAVAGAGDLRAAQTLSESAIEQQPQTDAAWHFRAALLLALRSNAAFECLDRAVSLAADKPLAELRAGALLLRHGHPNRAFPRLAKSAEALPKSAWAWYQLGKAQEATGRLDAARQSYTVASRLSPHDSRFARATVIRGGWWRALLALFKRK
jgi:tetratricopeptide (TPR) repeat protein